MQAWIVKIDRYYTSEYHGPFLFKYKAQEFADKFVKNHIDDEISVEELTVVAPFRFD